MQNAFIKRASIALAATQRHNWEHGTAMQAFLEAGDMDYVIAMAREAIYRQMEDGRAAKLGTVDSVTDPCACGEALIEAVRATDDAILKDGLDKLLVWALQKAPRNADGVLYHVDCRPEFWSDSTYMLPPFLAAAGYYKEALVNMDGYLDAMYDKSAHLMRHIWDDEKKEFIHAAFWGTGSGWTLAGLIRTAALLPEEMKEDRDRLRKICIELLDSVLVYLREDGLFHDILDDPSSFIETNMSQMTAYAIYRGVTEGWMDEAYIPYAEKMRNAALNNTDPYGFVTPVCGAPTFDKPGASPEAQAFSLMLEVAYQKYCNR